MIYWRKLFTYSKDFPTLKQQDTHKIMSNARTHLWSLKYFAKLFFLSKITSRFCSRLIFLKIIHEIFQKILLCDLNECFLKGFLMKINIITRNTNTKLRNRLIFCSNFCSISFSIMFQRIMKNIFVEILSVCPRVSIQNYSFEMLWKVKQPLKEISIFFKILSIKKRLINFSKFIYCFC